MTVFILGVCMLALLLGTSGEWDIPGLPHPSGVSTRTKIWTRNATFSIGQNWQGGVAPSPCDQVGFPRDMGSTAAFVASVLTSETQNTSRVEIGDLVLPFNGEVLLPTNGELDIGGEENRTPSCPGKVVMWKEGPLPAWLDPGNWLDADVAPWDLDAVPHLERIPCGQDLAVFPDLSFRLILPAFPVRVGGIVLEKRTVFSSWWIVERFRAGRNMIIPWNGLREPYPLVLANSEQDLATEEQCGLSPDAGDPESAQNLANEVCSYVTCPLPTCASPVRPHLHCCYVCGAVLEVRPRPAGRLSVVALRDVVRAATSDFAAGRSLAVHVGAVPPESGMLQVVVVAKPGASGDSLAQFLEAAISRTFPHVRIVKTVSGVLLAPTTAGSIAATILGPLILVLLLFAIMFYVVLGPSRQMLSASETPASFLFARFDNNQGSGEEATGVEVNLQRTGWVARSFRNPLFGAPAQLGTPSFADLQRTQEDEADHIPDENAEEPLSDLSSQQSEQPDPLIDIAL